MFKKKITAIVLSLGIGTTFLVSPSAFANPVIALTVNGVSITTANVASTPATVSVPSDNQVDAPDALKFSMSGIVPGTSVSVTSQNAFIISSLSTTLSPVTSAAGATSSTFNVGTGTTADFFAFTKSSGLGTITVSNSGSTFTYYIRGTAGPAYNLTFAPFTTASTSTIVKYSAKVTDVFGNVVVGVTPSLSQINLSATNPTSSNLEGVSEFTVTYPSTPGKSALSISISAINVVGLPAAVNQSSSFIDVVDANAALAAERAALAAEKAARAADKTAADAALAAEKAARAADKTAADAALAAEKAARAADKAASDKSILDLNASVAALTKQVAQLKVLYNKLAVRFKQKTIK
jgi:hypothetical protein